MNRPARAKDRPELGDDSGTRSSSLPSAQAAMRRDFDTEPDDPYSAPTTIQVVSNDVIAGLPSTGLRRTSTAGEPKQPAPSDGNPETLAAPVPAPSPGAATETPLPSVGATGVPCLHDDYRSSAHIRLGPRAPMSAARAASAALDPAATKHEMVDKRHWYLVRVALVAEGAVILSLLVAVAVLLWK